MFTFKLYSNIEQIKLFIYLFIKTYFWYNLQ